MSEQFMIGGSNYQNKLPQPYSAEHLPLIKTLCRDPFVSSLDIKDLADSRDGLRTMFASCDYSDLTGKLKKGSIVAWDTSTINRMAYDGEGLDGVDTIYFVHGNYELNSDEESAIRHIVNSRKIAVNVRTLCFAYVATSGQYQAFKKVRVDNGWLILVLADNHDLYTEHGDFIARQKHMALFKPRTAPALKEGFTYEFDRQALEDAKLYKNLCWEMTCYRNNCVSMGITPLEHSINYFPAMVACE